MKNLVDYIRESVDATQTSKDITFNFTDIENGKKAIEELQILATDSGIPLSIDNDKVTISFSKDTFVQAKEIIDYLDNFIKREGKVTRRASDEQYAQKLRRFETAMKELKAFKEECEASNEEIKPVLKNDDVDDKDNDNDSGEA